MYDGTLARDWRAVITFQQMIVLCDADGNLDMTADALSRRTGIPQEIIDAGIEILESPDPESRTGTDDGRRIRLMDDSRKWGWVLVNHSKYKALQDADAVREQTRERVRRFRERNGSKRTVTDGNTQKRHTDTDTNKKTHTSKSGDSDFSVFWSKYPRRENRKKAEAAWNNLPITKRRLALTDCVDRYKGVAKQFIPLPTTYLHGERWEDSREEVASDF